MPKRRSNVVDDFLEGSFLYYSKVQPFRKVYLIYSRLFGFERIGPKYHNEMEFWQEYTIVLTTKGCGQLTIHGQKYLLKKGDLMFVENNTFHRLESLPNQEWEIYFTHLYPNPIVSEIYQTLNINFGPVIPNVKEEDFVPYILRLCDLYSEEFNDTAFKMSAVIYEMLLRVLNSTKNTTSARVNCSITNVINYINENFTSPISIPDLLKECNYSKTHLERLFKKETKTTVRNYIATLRLSLAKELVASTSYSFEQIAMMVGLSEYRALHYLFVQYAKSTPSEYRKKKKRSVRKTNI